MNNNARWRFLLLAIGGLSLIGGLWGGLTRLGLNLPQPFIGLLSLHGPLMVSGLLGTIIGLERAVALGQRWPYLSPLLAGFGALALMGGLSVGRLLIFLSSLVLVGIFIVLISRQPTFFMATMLAGALAWLTGNTFWLAGWSIPDVVLWWSAFLVFTIAGERLEMSRLLLLSQVVHLAFFVAGGIYLAGLILAVVSLDAGVRLQGLGLVALALWLIRFDIARRTVKQQGLTRFIALSLLTGYAWLGIGGVLALVYGGVMAGLYYDAMLHSIFLGFVFAMIFGHAPIIFPAVLGVPIRFRPVFYSHLVLLHLSLILRVAGDLTGWLSGREWGGALNALALLLFLVNTILSTRSSEKSPIAA